MSCSRKSSVEQSGQQQVHAELGLHRRLEEEHLTKLYDIFHRNNKRLNDVNLREVLLDVARVMYSDEEWQTLFMRMNARRDGYVTWDEFVSFLILGFNQDEIKPGFAELDLPIQDLPRLLRSGHCYPMNKISYFPTVYSDRSISFEDASILTCDTNGTVNYWSLDLDFERQVKSISPCLKVQASWITDMVALPDVSVICLSSTERDLRFYDTSARKFELRVFFTYLPDVVTAMHYIFSDDVNIESSLFLGDMKGCIQIVYITPFDRGPFKSKPGMPLYNARYDDVAKGLISGFRVVHYGRQHTDFVRQLAYNHTLKTIFSCAECPLYAMAMVDMMKDKPSYIYKVETGVWCFAYYEGVHLIATGGSDCIVRLWNPFMPSHPTATFHGHHTGILSIVLQDNATRMYSLSQDKCIKVWDTPSQTCIQTYLGVPPETGEHSDLTAFYNPKSREWILGSNMLCVLRLTPEKPGEHTDGTTHGGAVSVVLYNELHKVVVTCGLDSRVITWNPWDGRKMMTIENAHIKSVHAKIVPIEITAACFDPGHHRLLSGAHDGSLKIWDFNTGICLRNMRLQNEDELKSVLWVPNRILVMGWNRRVTEFGDSGSDAMGQNSEFYKNWDLGHDEDISAAAVREGQTLVTGTYEGELIMWKLETGQPYKRYNVSEPTTRIKIQYKTIKRHKEIKEPKKQTKAVLKKSIAQPGKLKSKSIHQTEGEGAQEHKSPLKTRRVSQIEVPMECLRLRKLAIHAMLFLKAREMDPNVGTLLISLENGTIQMWSHHITGGFLISFSAIHKAGDYVISMTTDKNNEFLFTGTCVGYIKIWLLKNYCTGREEMDNCVTLVPMMRYRLMFPFLWGAFFMGRAQRIALHQPKPILLSSYKGHLSPIAGLAYIDMAKVLLSSSADCSVRMWTLSGRYIQTLGTFKPWKFVYPEGVPEDFAHTIPPDTKRVISSTTFRVLNGGGTTRQLSIKQLKKQAEKELTKIDNEKIYGSRLEEPILNTYLKPQISNHIKEIQLDKTLAYIPIYDHLIMPQPKDKQPKIVIAPKLRKSIKVQI